MSNDVSNFWWENDTFFIEFADGQVIGYENAYISSMTYGDLEEDNDVFKTEELPKITFNNDLLLNFIEQVYKK